MVKFNQLSHDDNDNDALSHPFEPCPRSPNCVIRSIRFNTAAHTLFNFVKSVIQEMNTHEFQSDTESSTIQAVYRIPVFGFKDDVRIMIKSNIPDHSVLHIKSASREGYSDLGVNNRRVNKILKRVKQKLQYFKSNRHA